MLKWLRRLQSKDTDKEAQDLLQQAHQSNEAAIQAAKARTRATGKQADKMVKQVYDVAEKIYIATGQGR